MGWPVGNMLLWLANPDETLLRCRQRPGLISSADMAAYGEAQGPSGIATVATARVTAHG